MSCPYLFLSILRPGRTDFYALWLKGRVSVKDGPFGVRTMGHVIWGNMPLKTPEMGVNRQIQAKTPKYKNHNISEITNPI